MKIELLNKHSIEKNKEGLETKIPYIQLLFRNDGQTSVMLSHYLVKAYWIKRKKKTLFLTSTGDDILLDPGEESSKILCVFPYQETDKVEVTVSRDGKRPRSLRTTYADATLKSQEISKKDAFQLRLFELMNKNVYKVVPPIDPDVFAELKPMEPKYEDFQPLPEYPSDKEFGFIEKYLPPTDYRNLASKKEDTFISFSKAVERLVRECRYYDFKGIDKLCAQYDMSKTEYYVSFLRNALRDADIFMYGCKHNDLLEEIEELEFCDVYKLKLDNNTNEALDSCGEVIYSNLSFRDEDVTSFLDVVEKRLQNFKMDYEIEE